MKDSRDQDGNKERGEERRTPVVRGLAKRLFSTGAEAMQITEEGLRTLAGEVSAKEIVKELVDGVTRGTDTIQSIFAGEARRYLDTINFRDELGRVLSNYTIEVNARINFVPREKAPEKKKGKASRDTDAAKLEAEKLKIKFVSKDEEIDGPGSSESGA